MGFLSLNRISVICICMTETPDMFVCVFVLIMPDAIRFVFCCLQFGVLEAGTAYEKLPTNCGGQEPCSDREAMVEQAPRLFVIYRRGLQAFRSSFLLRRVVC